MTPTLLRRVLALALAAAAVLAVPPARGQISISGSASGLACNSSQAISTASSGTTQIVALTSGATIYVCAWDVVADGTVAVKWQYGTGSNCGTGTTDIDGARGFIVNSGIAKGSGFGTLFKTAVSNALCINLNAAVGARGSVTYAQF
jgi:hypothetical protein